MSEGGRLSVLCRDIHVLTLKAPTPQNGQTHSNNLSAIADKLFDVFDHFVKLTLKLLIGALIPTKKLKSNHHILVFFYAFYFRF